MLIQRIAAFSDGDKGGNPAGVVVTDELPDASAMQALATEVGYSETAFAAPAGKSWRVRYFAPESEVPFCGHATIALGAALAAQFGNRVFDLELNDTRITVEARVDGNAMHAALQSPQTSSQAASAKLIDESLQLFGLVSDDLDPRIPAALAMAGSRHLVLALNDHQKLRDMMYDFEDGKRLMQVQKITTISLLFAEREQLFHARNPFASGGVYEDAATGAAAAALGGYLRDIDWPHGGAIEIIQGEDMGMRSLLRAEIPPKLGTSIRVSGTARRID